MSKLPTEYPPFAGFSPKSLEFFRLLAKNNNREWFKKHRDEYLSSVADPMTRLVSDLGPVMLELDPALHIEPKRTIARIHRDTRFSKDKSPYRPRMWFAFKRNLEGWSGDPTYFFQVEEKQYLFGMGAYAASPETMRNFRSRIDEEPERFAEIIVSLSRQKSLKLASEKYKREIPNEHGKAVQEWYQSKSIALIAYREPDKILYSKKLVDLLLDRFVMLKPLYDFLWGVTKR